MLNTDDFKDIRRSQAIIEHLKDGSPNRMNLQKIIQIFEFILTSAAAIMFNKQGKPKNTIQLVGSIFQIIGFVRDLVRMITGEAKKSEPKSEPRRIAAKTARQIDESVKGKLSQSGIASGTARLGKEVPQSIMPLSEVRKYLKPKKDA